MTMSDGRHIVIGVQELATRRVVEPNAFASNNMQRLCIEQSICRSEQLFSSLGQQPRGLGGDEVISFIEAIRHGAAIRNAFVHLHSARCPQYAASGSTWQRL